MKRDLKGCFFIILSAILFGCNPLFTKEIYQGGCNTITLIFLRSFAIIPLLFVLIKIDKTQTFSVTKKQKVQIIFLSTFGMVLTPLLLFASYLYISSGASTTIHFIYPVFVLLGCAIFYKEKIGLVKTICVLFSTIGVFLFYTPGDDGNFLGIIFAFLSGITFAAYVVYLGKSGIGKVNSLKLLLYMSIFSSLCIFVFGATTSSLTLNMSATAWVLAIVFSHSVSVGGMLLFQLGTKIIGAQRASILSTFEPITSIVIGVLVYKEFVSIKTFFGIVLILSSVIILTKYGNSPDDRESSTAKSA